MKAICVDNDGLYENCLVVGKTYDVQVFDHRHYSVVDELGSISRPMQTRFKLVTGEVTTSNPVPYSFTNMKFRVKDAAHSEAIQTHLFSLGYSWSTFGEGIRQNSEKFLYTSDVGHILFGTDEDCFTKHGGCEMQLEATTTYTLAPVPEPKKVVMVAGKEYDEEYLKKVIYSYEECL